MAGDLVGIDGIGSRQHSCDAVALEDTRICSVPMELLDTGGASNAVRILHKVMSQQIVSQHAAMLLLGSMPAEDRVVAFLLSLSERSFARGYSSSQFVLRMSRRDIGSYLGLTLETVSRILSHLDHEGLVGVDRKSIHLLDLVQLRHRRDAVRVTDPA
jgi:CRP/FNR family transcriptional regulator